MKAKTANAVLSTPAVAAVMESQEAGGGGITGARKFAVESAGIPFWRRGEFLISILLLMMVCDDRDRRAVRAPDDLVGYGP